MLKAYNVYDSEYHDSGASEFVFANNSKEAKKFGARYLDVEDFTYIRVRRKKEWDSFLKEGADKPYTVTDAATLRKAGWCCEGDDRCSTCGLYTMDNVFPVCEGCFQCAECGCDCEEEK